MGLIKEIVKAVAVEKGLEIAADVMRATADVVEVATDVASDAYDAAKNATKPVLQAGGKVIKAAVKTTGKVAKATANTISEASQNISEGVANQREKNNLNALKKEARDVDYALFVTKEVKLGKGIYTIQNKEGEERFHTLQEGTGKGFSLSFYNNERGKYATIEKNTKTTKSFFGSVTSDTKYTLVINYNEIGSFIKTKENKNTIITTDFNRWIATGEFKKNSYKIFDRESGKTIATISKKHSQASTFSVQCDYDQNEPFVIFMTVLIDILFDEE